MNDVSKAVVALLTMAICVSCGLMTHSPPHVAAAGKISHRFIKEVCDKYSYRPFGTGGAFNGTVNGFLITFETNEIVSEARAEKEIMEMRDLLFQLVDNDKEIRPYLVAWPFPEKDSCITIMFFDHSGKFRQPPHLCLIRTDKGGFCKRVIDPETENIIGPEEYEKKYGRKFNEAEPS